MILIETNNTFFAVAHEDDGIFKPDRRPIILNEPGPTAKAIKHLKDAGADSYLSSTGKFGNKNIQKPQPPSPYNDVRVGVEEENPDQLRLKLLEENPGINSDADFLPHPDELRAQALDLVLSGMAAATGTPVEHVRENFNKSLYRKDEKQSLIEASERIVNKLKNNPEEARKFLTSLRPKEAPYRPNRKRKDLLKAGLAAPEYMSKPVSTFATRLEGYLPRGIYITDPEEKVTHEVSDDVKLAKAVLGLNSKYKVRLG